MAQTLKPLEFRFSVVRAGRDAFFRGLPTPVFRDMRKRTLRNSGRVWVWLLIAGPLSAGCAKSRSEGAAPAVTAAAAPSAAAPQTAPAAPQAAGAPAPVPTVAASVGSRAHEPPRSEPRREEHHAAPSTLREKARYGGEPLDTLAQAQAALERANRRLVELYAPVTAKAKAAAENGLSQSQRCDIACKAFASLERAADAVCRLAGEQDARCKHARHLVDVNRQRVASCHCPNS